MSLNDTSPVITQDCINYCQTVLDKIPPTFHNEWVIFLSLGTLSLFLFWFLDSDGLRFDPDVEKHIPIIRTICFRFGIVMNIVTMIWFIWF